MTKSQVYCFFWETVYRVGQKKWYLSYITLHCTRGITFFGTPCILATPFQV